MYTTPAPPDVTRRNWRPSTLQGTLGSLEGEQGQSSSILPGFVALLASFLVLMAACILWNWNKRKKRRVPYFQVAPSLTLPPPRQRAKNIYDFLPQQQVELGRHQSSGFSTESLLSRESDGPEREASQADGSLQIHIASVNAVEYTVGIYDNGTVPQMCGHLAPSAHHVSVRTSGNNSSISSRESSDYVNIHTAEEAGETLTSTKSTPENHLGLHAPKLEFAEGGRAGCEAAATDHTGLWALGSKSSDLLSDGEDSSQTSNDYVNMTALDLEDIQENQPELASQCCRDYENVPSSDANGSQLQTWEEGTSSNTDRGEPVWRALSSVYYMAFQPSTQSKNGEGAHTEDQSSEDSNDYENVLPAELEGRDCEQGPDAWHPSDEGTPNHLAEKLYEVAYPVGSLVTEISSEDA
ncbi:lymphocyte transmembrane adapter 1 isoform X1 [Peromyscus californicus insignis]|uniref:lymphocyte transmembrane adapter 1 isoform X1 n=2 Tax=Peromyscus californicus insignis TaxID=564181 RepID=UPI0022A75BC4|nr:lymphocyte transmembrane adapter 1 isoform X1 [Peromyscus californicus insignis]XP_052592940.1 lymphocyte transmembrane adapter 1 isoform X1 [Peromyscus californicus insignis]XP_052592942.1 lymphocyte transmembrane adapter 1 isoform X1 [Peromyscus californicus insignis]